MGLSAGTTPHGLSMGLGLPHIMVAVLKGKHPKNKREPGRYHIIFADLHIEVTQCHFCHIISVRAATEFHSYSTKGRKSKLPSLRGHGIVQEEQQYCSDHFWKIPSLPVTYSDIPVMQMPFQRGDL